MGDDFWILLILLVLAFPVMAIAALVVALNQKSAIREAGNALRQMRDRIDALELRLRAQEAGPPPAPAPAAVVEAPEPVVAQAPAAPEEPVRPEPEAAAPEPIAAAPEAPSPVEAPARPSLEERLASRWFIWVGAAALALAGLFLVKYSIDNALMTPAARIGLGLLLGVALVVAGEWVRRRPSQRQIAALSHDQAPGALVSGGIFTLFASLLAAHRLYGLIGPTTAFAGLALTAFAAFGLSVLHGPIVAVVGLLAGFATPALIGAEEPSAWGLFSYLALVVAASIGVVWYRKWGWLAFGTLAGSVLWGVLYITAAGAGAELLPLALFLGVLVGGILWLAERETPREAPDIWQGPDKLDQPQICAWAAAALSAGLLAWGMDAAGHPLNGLWIIAVALFLLALAGRLFERFDALFVVGVGLVLAVFATWPVWPLVHAAGQELTGADGVPYRGLVAPALSGYLALLLIFAVMVAVLGAWLLRGARHPAMWAAASAIGAALLLAAGYWRLQTVTQSLLWAGLSVAGGMLALTMVKLLNGHREHRGYRLSLGVYAAAVVAAASFALGFVLEQAWFTVALSLMLPALAWIEEKLDLPEMRAFALAVATAVLLRLVLNPYVLDYEATAQGGAHWVLYGYGVPAAAFWLASRMFGKRGQDRAVVALEGGALVFALLLVSLELRILIGGGIRAPKLGLLEASLHSAVWLVAGWWRGRAHAVSGRAFDRYASAILIGLAGLCIVFVQLGIANPLFTDDSVGAWKLLDALLTGYLLPALLVFLVLRDVRLGAPQGLRQAAAAGALGLGLFWVTMETRHWFLGERLGLWRGVSDAESYAWSAVWLVSSFLLLGLGILLRQPIFRHGALAVMAATVLKVFLLDLSGLTGLWRVASLLGLGLSLVAIGLLYQRLVFTPRAPVPPQSPAGG